MTNLRLVSVPCANKKEARKIAQVLLEERLVGCANLVPGVESWFRWEGKIEKSSEVLLFMKTKQSLVSKIMKRIKLLHSYECPVIEVFEIKDGNREFFEWIDSEMI